MASKRNYLKNLLWCFALVVLLQVIKKYSDHRLPGSLLFHHYLLTGFQLLVLVGTIIHLLFPNRGFLFKILAILALFGLPELLFTWWIQHPAAIPTAARSLLNTYSTQAETNIIQFMPQSSVYSDSLFYTLKPSARFLFRNPEFADSFFINRAGLRDDDRSLQHPSVICLGDSYAMGWGVAQAESFPEQLEAMLHKKVLNAAVSSYGTARELKNLYRLDTAALETIIIQYCRNDYRENREYMQNDQRLPVSSRRVYDSLLNDHYWSTRWFPGKRAVTIAKLYAEQKTNDWFFPNRVTWKDSAQWHLQKAAAYFTDILYRSAINFNKVKVLVVDMNEQQTMNNDFIGAVNTLIRQPHYAARFANHLILVPVADLLTANDYYILDPHIKASGHRKIAERLRTFITPH